jgi:hypothetical protein
MSAEYLMNRRGGQGKRFAVMVFLLLLWATPAVYAAAAGVLVPFPDEGEDPARRKRPVSSEDMTFPGTINDSPVVPVQVHPLYPNDGAIFPPNAAITVSWRMPDEEALPDSLRKVPKYFRVELVSHTYPGTTTVKYFPYIGKSDAYNGIFNAPTPGRYGWQTTAVMNDGSIIKSPARYFVVKQPYYYNNYFTVLQDIYPHYYYDSQDHIRQ